MKPYGMDGESYTNFLLIVDNSIVKENVRKKSVLKKEGMCCHQNMVIEIL
jgi:hypothetical protein